MLSKASVNSIVLSILLKAVREEEARCSPLGIPFPREGAMTKKALFLVDDFLASLRVAMWRSMA